MNRILKKLPQILFVISVAYLGLALLVKVSMLND